MMLARTVEVSRRYGDTLALDRVTLDIPAGGVVGLLGPNGAGKSTLINLLVGLRRPSSGTAELFGGDPRDPANRRRIGVTPQETGLPSTLRVRECVEFVSRHFPDPVPHDELLDRFGLREVARRQTGGLSGGQRRRLAVALAFAGRPRLVFLDEPTTGLDVQARRAVWDAVRAFADEGGTVVLTSHYLEEIEALASRVVVVGRGRILADDTVEAIRAMVGIHRVTLTLGSAPTARAGAPNPAVPATANTTGPANANTIGPPNAGAVGSLHAGAVGVVDAVDAAGPAGADRIPELPELAGIVGIEHADGRTSLLTPDADQLVRDLVHAGIEFRGLQVQPTTLEEAFLTLTGR